MRQNLLRAVRVLFAFAILASFAANVWSYYRLSDAQIIQYAGEGRVIVTAASKSSEKTEILVTVFRTKGLDTGMDRMMACGDVRDGDDGPQLTYTGGVNKDNPRIVITPVETYRNVSNTP